MLLWPAPAITTSNFSVVDGRSPGTEACAASATLLSELSAKGASAALFTNPRLVILVIAPSRNSQCADANHRQFVLSTFSNCHSERSEESLFGLMQGRRDSSLRSE